MILETDNQNRIEILEARFMQIGHERLQGLPVYNDDLEVEAVGFQSCRDGLLGALVTPWFINIVILPFEVNKWRSDELGTKHTFELDSGEHEFVLGEDEVIGRYFFRSVVSPPHCYRQQAPARQEAVSALQKLLGMKNENVPEEIASQQVKLNPEPPKQQDRREFMRNIFNDSAGNTP